METEYLRALVASIEEGSLSRAARRLRIDLSTISRRITSLERMVECKILVRTGRGVRATVEGERLCARARRILRELDVALTEAQGAPAPELGQLRLSVTVEMALTLLPRPLAQLAEKHPGVMLDVYPHQRRVALLEEDFDAAIRLGSPTTSNLIARPIGEVCMVICGRPMAAPVKTLADLATHPFVLIRGAPPQTRGHLNGKEVQLSMAGPIRVGTFTEAGRMAAESGMLVVLPSFTATSFLKCNRLAVLVPGLRLSAPPVHMLLPAQHRNAVILRDLQAFIQAALEASNRRIYDAL